MYINNPRSSENLKFLCTYQNYKLQYRQYLMSCSLGFFLSESGSCINCSSNCKNCISVDTCSICSADYFVNGGQCSQFSGTNYQILIIALTSIFGCFLLMIILTIIGRKCIRTARDREDEIDGNKMDSQKQLNDNRENNTKWILSQAYPIFADNQSVCVICLSGSMNTITSCGHKFHNHCLGEWFKRNRNCPVCKSKDTKILTIFCQRCKQYYLEYKVTKDYYGFTKTKFICSTCLEIA